MSGDPLDLPYRPHFFQGRQLAIGEGGPSDEAFSLVGVRPTLDPKLNRPKRPCSSCGRRFAPTAKRRMLCRRCFERASGPDG